MTPHPATEITSYLQHQDYSLAIRRLLDTAMDTGDELTIQKTIQISKKYRDTVKDNYPEKAIADLTPAVIELLKHIPSAMETKGGVKLLVEATEISKTYVAGGFKLQPVSLSVFTGDILGVVGENGNGKTTLLRCLAGQLDIDAGTLHHPEILEKSFYGVKHKVAFIPQRINKWYGFLKDNLHFSAAIAGVTGATNEMMVDFMIERLNLSEYTHLTWNQISSGYRTRFEIARVLLQRPTLVILDEPLANLDINAQQTILTDLKYMAKSLNHPMGVVLSSQQLHEVEKVADNVMFIRQGACLYQTRQDENDKVARDFIMELETVADREQVIKVLGSENIQVQFNGGFFTISSKQYTVQEMVGKLVATGIPISYFRDITHSTKRFFK
jgi:ABC-2 type transport system ATP-binding protein